MVGTVNKATVQEAMRDLVLANRIMAREGVIDDFGHVSVRHPDDAGRYFLSRSRSPLIVSFDDIMEFELDGTPVDPRGRAMYAERPIHGAIFMARPDVNCVAHHHARSVLPFTITGAPLRPAFHMAAVIGAEVPLWDSQHEFGDTNMLIDTMPMGHSLAKTLGNNRTVLIRGHGAVVVGENIRNVIVASVYLKENAELVLASRDLGEIAYLTPGEIEKTGALLRTELATNRAWDYYVSRAGFQGL
ncbi:MAG: class II aldolase/adducin family protein [Xanthobacteraceae bacterium]|nr:class II aldolase/adducin family protein [Xanthobacteraceae bacterium]